MENVAQPLRHTYGAAQKDHLPAGLMRLPHRLCHVFDAPVKLFAGLPLHKKRHTRRAELFEAHALVSSGQSSQVVRRDKNLARGEGNAPGILSLVEALVE